MSGGSEEPESPHDRQCPHCGLYYQDRGNSFVFHKATCGGRSSNDDSTETTTPESREPAESTVEFPEAPGTEDDEEEASCPDCGGDLIVYPDVDEVQCEDCEEWWLPEEESS